MQHGAYRLLDKIPGLPNLIRSTEWIESLEHQALILSLDSHMTLARYCVS